MNLDGSKVTPVGDMPTDILKQTIDIYLPIMAQLLTITVTLMI